MTKDRNVLADFSESYNEARGKFLSAASRAGGKVTTYVHPEASGPDGGSLCTDVASIGPSEAERCLLVISGTHGLEGFTGSAAQIGFLTSREAADWPDDVRLVMVHGINPFGFAHVTRTTENNVDLNRNFIDFEQPLPVNPTYRELHEATCPSVWTDQSKAGSQRQIDTWIQSHGRSAWFGAMNKGQYEEPTGLIYGGLKREWSNALLEQIVASELSGAKKVAFIDWHTGLGDVGEPFFLCFNDQKSELWERGCAWWGRDNIDNSDGFEGGERPKYEGLLFQGVQRFLAPAEMVGAVIEFGTGPMEEMFNWLRTDRWLRFGDHPDNTELLSQYREGVKNAFYPTDPDWRLSVAKHAMWIHQAALEGVAAW